jgi:hypothetical protein
LKKKSSSTGYSFDSSRKSNPAKSEDQCQIGLTSARDLLVCFDKNTYEEELILPETLITARYSSGLKEYSK